VAKKVLEGPKPAVVEKQVKPEVLREFQMTSMEALALKPAHENRIRASEAQRAAEEQFADILEEVAERLSAKEGVKLAVADIKNVNWKKKIIYVRDGVLKPEKAEAPKGG
jgi:hypothetical protein